MMPEAPAESSKQRDDYAQELSSLEKLVGLLGAIGSKDFPGLPEWKQINALLTKIQTNHAAVMSGGENIADIDACIGEAHSWIKSNKEVFNAHFKNIESTLEKIPDGENREERKAGWRDLATEWPKAIDSPHEYRDFIATNASNWKQTYRDIHASYTSTIGLMPLQLEAYELKTKGLRDLLQLFPEQTSSAPLKEKLKKSIEEIEQFRDEMKKPEGQKDAYMRFHSRESHGRTLSDLATQAPKERIEEVIAEAKDHIALNLRHRKEAITADPGLPREKTSAILNDIDKFNDVVDILTEELPTRLEGYFSSSHESASPEKTRLQKRWENHPKYYNALREKSFNDPLLAINELSNLPSIISPDNAMQSYMKKSINPSNGVIDFEELSRVRKTSNRFSEGVGRILGSFTASQKQDLLLYEPFRGMEKPYSQSSPVIEPQNNRTTQENREVQLALGSIVENMTNPLNTKDRINPFATKENEALLEKRSAAMAKKYLTDLLTLFDHYPENSIVQSALQQTAHFITAMNTEPQYSTPTKNTYVNNMTILSELANGAMVMASRYQAPRNTLPVGPLTPPLTPTGPRTSTTQQKD